MAISPNKARARLDRAQTKRDKRLDRLNSREFTVWFWLQESANWSVDRALPRVCTRVLRRFWNFRSRMLVKARADAGKKFAEAQARYGSLQSELPA